MGTITVNVDDDTEQRFRRRVEQKYGRKKGALGKALTEALDEWTRRKKHFERCTHLLSSGADMGKMTAKSRDEMHDRN